MEQFAPRRGGEVIERRVTPRRGELAKREVAVASGRGEGGGMIEATVAPGGGSSEGGSSYFGGWEGGE